MVELAYTTPAPTALLRLGGMCWRQGLGYTSQHIDMNMWNKVMLFTSVCKS